MKGIEKNSVFSLLMRNKENNQEEEIEKIFDKLPVTNQIPTK